VAVNRYVKQNAQGSWDVLKEGHRRSVIQEPSKQAAVSRARGLVQRDGGGEVRVMNDVGKVMDTRTVTSPTKSAANSSEASSSRPRATKRR
jgi:hypothetical protein